MTIVPPEIEAYAAASTTPPDAALEALAELTQRSTRAPQMLTGHVEGRLLETLAFVTGARRILEIGTFTGYSALSLAAGMPSDGRLVTCEVSREHAEIAQAQFDASPLGERIELRLGPALETVRSEPGPWDLVFIDADKTGYPGYVNAVLPKLAPRGLIVLDNTLRGGAVAAAPGDGDDAGTAAMRALNARLREDPRLVATLLTVRDGVTLVRRADGDG